MTSKTISVIIPACNESTALPDLLQKLTASQYVSQYVSEIILVDDASSDNTKQIVSQYNIKIVSRPYQAGNGAAIKAGARIAKGEILVFMDADGQHNPEDISKLLEEFDKGYDMVVGARNLKSHASIFRMLANTFYNNFATWMTSHTIRDLTSGFRAVNADKFREFLHLLPNGFSYPTTITMAFFRSGYPVSYIPVNVGKRKGSSHIRPIRDGIRFLLIIFKIGTLYTPLKFFVPISFISFASGVCYYIYTYLTQGRFTNMSALLITTSILIFLIGIVSEQLTMLFYRDKK